MTDDELRAWAENVSGVNPIWKVPIAVLRLLDENAALRKQVEGHCERIAAQSELLSKRAEGLPADLVSGVPDSAVVNLRRRSVEEAVAKVRELATNPMMALMGEEVIRSWAGEEPPMVPFDGSTGMSSTIAGRKSSGAGA